MLCTNKCTDDVYIHDDVLAIFYTIAGVDILVYYSNIRQCLILPLI